MYNKEKFDEIQALKAANLFDILGTARLKDKDLTARHIIVATIVAYRGSCSKDYLKNTLGCVHPKGEFEKLIKDGILAWDGKNLTFCEDVIPRELEKYPRRTLLFFINSVFNIARYRKEHGINSYNALFMAMAAALKFNWETGITEMKGTNFLGCSSSPTSSVAAREIAVKAGFFRRIGNQHSGSYELNKHAYLVK